MNNELIDALQCTSHFALYQDCYEKNCYANSGKGLYCNIPKLMADAADAIERLQAELTESQKRIEALQHANGKMFRDIEELRVKNETYRKLILLSTGEINELRFKLHLDDMEIDTVPSIENLKVPSGKENAHDAIRPN